MEKLFIQASLHRVKRSWMRIHHALEQLDESQIWQRPNAEMNSIGNLIQHICGNLRQWIGHGIGKLEDARTRNAEFENGGAARTELIERLNETRVIVDDSLANFPAAQLSERIRVQGFDLTHLEIIYSALTHLEGHTGQIIFYTRMLKGADYKLFWEPANAEQAS